MTHARATPVLLATPIALVALLLLMPGLSAAASPTPGAAPALGPTPQQWAYGVEKNLSFTTTSNGTTYSVVGSFAYAVVFTQTNTSATTFQLEVQRTLGFTLTATYSGPFATANLHVRGFENDSGFANYTTLGTVFVNGTGVSAVADQNQSYTLSAGYAQNSSVTVNHHTATGDFTARLASQGHSTFTPALGIVPDNVSVGMSWNASTVFAHSGAISGSYNWSRTKLTGVSASGSGSLGGSDSVSGAETAYGTDLGSVTLQNGLSGQQIVLSTPGPLQPRDGILWTTSGTDLFHNERLANTAFGLISVATDRLDWVPHRGHLGLSAAQTGFTPAPDANSVAGSSVTESTTTLSSGAQPQASPSAGQEIQAQPMAVPAAEAIQGCIGANQGGCYSPGGNPSSPALGHVPAGLFALVLVAAVAALLAALVVAGRRRTPKYPTTAPAGYAPVPPPPTTPSPRAPPAAPALEEPDPLGRIW